MRKTRGIREARPFHIMCKPAGPDCNLRCRYCFYTEKKALFGSDTRFRMTNDVLEAYVRKYIEAEPAPEVNFGWQGGEPTLMGLDFFRKAVSLQKRFSKGKKITNSLQTNGTLLDDEWCRFLAQEDFLVGLSIDGPPHLHNLYRVDRGGNPTFDRIMSAMRRLQQWNVQYNTLTCVTAESAKFPLEIYRFLKKVGARFLQFIPIVERAPDAQSRQLGLQLTEPRPGREPSGRGADSTQVMPWSLGPRQYGSFLTAIFDEWVRHDVGRIFVQLFDVSLAAWMGQDPPLCNFSKKCGNAMIIEHNGDLYSCDHFVYPDHRLGNIMSDSVEEMVTRPAVRNLREFKWTGLPPQCRRCDVLFVCHGGCPKNRFARTSSGHGGLNYLCEGYKAFFRHIDPYMKEMANLLRHGRPPAEIMYNMYTEKSSSHSDWQGAIPSFRKAGRKVGRNDPCPCGSGKKFKHCCGRNL
jgi:uncharacterized protein